MTLLSMDNNKTVKGEKIGVLTAVLYLAPGNISGYEVCPKRSHGCTKACLYTAGMGVFSTVQTARIDKTKLFFEQREAFLFLLRQDIKILLKKARKNNMIAAVRLNGTSDIEWTRFGIMEEFPEVQFYDYTKVVNRLTKPIPNNYHLTFSRNESNEEDCNLALSLGVNVAMVFDTNRKESFPSDYNNTPIQDGDVNDVRFLDRKGHIIALRAKGQAKKDDTGFVIKLKK